MNFISGTCLGGVGLLAPDLRSRVYQEKAGEVGRNGAECSESAHNASAEAFRYVKNVRGQSDVERTVACEVQQT